MGRLESRTTFPTVNGGTEYQNNKREEYQILGINFHLAHHWARPKRHAKAGHKSGWAKPGFKDGGGQENNPTHDLFDNLLYIGVDKISKCFLGNIQLN